MDIQTVVQLKKKNKNKKQSNWVMKCITMKYTLEYEFVLPTRLKKSADSMPPPWVFSFQTITLVKPDFLYMKWGL